MMVHTVRTRQGSHTDRTSKVSRKLHSFRGDGYLAQLMGELDRAAISVRLAQAREEVGLTQVELAELLQVHFRSVQNYESPRERRIPFDLLDRWAQVTGRPKEWLLHGDEPRIVADDRLQAIEDELARVTAGLERLEQLLREIDKEITRN
jgi:transcriptional regulator with XRE-family HTH domain